MITLPAGKSGYVIESGPLIHMLDEERDLVDPPGPGLDDRSVLLAMGDPDFDWGGETDGLVPGTVASRVRGTSGPCTSLDDVVFGPLPSTALETATIVQLWRRNHRDAVRLTGPDCVFVELNPLI